MQRPLIYTERSMGAIHATMNISLDACCDHTQVLADDEFHAHMSTLFGQAAALLFGRNTYDLLYGYWPQLASSGAGTPAEVHLAHILDEKPKYVVSSREPAPGWNARRTEAGSIHTLKLETDGTLLVVASPMLARTLLQWDLVDEYHVAISPVIAGRGPTFLAGLQRESRATLLNLDRLSSGVVIHRYGFAAAAATARATPAADAGEPRG